MNDKVELWMVFIWPALSGLLNIILRTRTPEEWVELNLVPAPGAAAALAGLALLGARRRRR